ASTGRCCLQNPALRPSDIVFRWDEVLDFEGNSGPYLQYAYVTISGILRKLGQPPSAQFAGRVKKIAFDQTEMRLLRKLAKFPDAVEDAAADYMPHIICTYLYELSQDFNSFYEAVWVLKEKDKELKNFRIALIAACGTAIQRGLGLLGIEAIQEM
ncbi:MAG TPA: DALR anticodon-binding domain-containing protein, partial [Patescibacteria group bacterium]|nr:DALR anticodon-binding domain-containing protein [Patescibacteria group bacterium]